MLFQCSIQFMFLQHWWQCSLLWTKIFWYDGSHELSFVEGLLNGLWPIFKELLLSWLRVLPVSTLGHNVLNFHNFSCLNIGWSSCFSTEPAWWLNRSPSLGELRGGCFSDCFGAFLILKWEILRWRVHKIHLHHVKIASLFVKFKRFSSL